MIRRDRLLWAAAATGPSAWFADLVVSYALAPGPGAREGDARLHLVSLASFLVAAAALAVAIRQMRAVPVEKEEHTHDASLQRARLLAVAAVVLCAFSLVLIAGTEIPNWTLDAGDEP